MLSAMKLSLFAMKLGWTSALQLPFYVNTDAVYQHQQPQQPVPYVDKPLVDTTSLQATIHSENLLARAETLFEIAKLAEADYNHPTRVIGSKGACTPDKMTSICKAQKFNSCRTCGHSRLHLLKHCCSWRLLCAIKSDISRSLRHHF
jgi:hypothetical protein